MLLLLLINCDVLPAVADVTALKFPPNYDNALMPPRGVNNEPVHVKVEFAIEDFPTIDDSQLTFSVTCFLHLAWNDTRLHLTEEGNEEEAVPLDIGLLTQLWIPDFFVYNLSDYREMTSMVPMKGLKLKYREIRLFHTVTITFRRAIE